MKKRDIRIDSQCRITIPINIRRDLQLRQGDRILFVERNDRDYILRPMRKPSMTKKGHKTDAR